MAPPAYGESDRHDDYHDYLVDHNFKDNPRLGENVDRLSGWLEFLFHPEIHQHDREAFVPVGKTGGGGPTGYEWQEVPEPVATGMGHPGAPKVETEFRSVLHEYRYSDFLDPLVAVSTQQVETGANLLAVATAAVNNIYWAGQKFTHELANFPSEWKGTASVEAERFVARLESVATQLNLVVGDLRELLPKYGLAIRAARINLDAAVSGIVDKFEEKFHTRAEFEFSFDVKGFLVGVIAAAGVTYLSGGAGAVIGAAMIAEAWSGTFKEAANNLFNEAENEEKVAQIKGVLWKDLAASYLRAVDEILREATAGINHLNAEMAELATNFAKAVPKFEDSLPQLDEAPR